MSLLFQETNTTPSIDSEWHWGQLPPASPALQSWLHEPGSLTRRLRRHCAQFHVKVLADGVLRPLMPAQAEWLQAGQGYCREVLLCCDNLPWVYATSLYSPATQAALPALSGLGSKALGELMFKAPDLTRTPFELAGLTPTQYQQLAEHAGLAATEPAIMPWARRSALSTGKASVLVTELFLPNSAPYQDLV